MKTGNLLVFVTQLGLSAVIPPVAFIWLAVWLRDKFQWGSWVIVAAVIIGVICAVEGVWNTVKAMERLAKDKKAEEPPLAFNDHD